MCWLWKLLLYIYILAFCKLHTKLMKDCLYFWCLLYILLFVFFLYYLVMKKVAQRPAQETTLCQLYRHNFVPYYFVVTWFRVGGGRFHLLDALINWLTFPSPRNDNNTRQSHTSINFMLVWLCYCVATISRWIKIYIKWPNGHLCHSKYMAHITMEYNLWHYALTATRRLDNMNNMNK